jgi:hypothetical protein
MEIGHIDSVYLASEGQLWFLGWMKNGSPTEFPAIVIDRKKYPGGASVIQYRRQDLPSNCVGVVGVMDTDWAPPLISSDFFVYVGANAEFQMRASPRTNVLTVDTFLAAWNQVRELPIAGRADAIGSLLTSGSHWMPGNATAAGISTDGAVDRLYMLPGFGCFAEGWAVSPAKRVRTFELKIGDCLMIADDSSTYFKPRPDLSPVFGDRTALTERAGFVTVFRGGIQNTASGAPLLRIIHEDGTSVVVRLDLKVLELLDPIGNSADVLKLFPGLRQETFYPAFLEALERYLGDSVCAPVELAINPARKVVVLRLPRERGNLTLCIDRIAARPAISNSKVGICLVTDRSHNLSETKLLFNELRKTTASLLSLVCVDDRSEGFNELPLIMGRLGADQFVYAGRGIMLNSIGWEYAAKSLANSRDSIDYFEIVDDRGEADRVFGAFSASCFGWSTAALLEWRPSAPYLLGGIFGKSGLPEGRNAHFRRTGAALRLESPHQSQLADMINEDLLNARGNSNRGV